MSDKKEEVKCELCLEEKATGVTEFTMGGSEFMTCTTCSRIIVSIDNAQLLVQPTL